MEEINRVNITDGCLIANTFLTPCVGSHVFLSAYLTVNSVLCHTAILNTGGVKNYC